MLTVLAPIVRQLRQHANTGYPEEVCGLLVGRWEPSARIVTEAVAIDNLRRDRARDRYELDPKQHLRAQRHARQRGLQLVGVYHTHPDAAAVPSDHDLTRARQIWAQIPSWSYLIISARKEGVAAMRSWVLFRGRFEEETIDQADDNPCT